ncbi:MAG: hypothetical protein ACOCQS_01070 [Bacillota bacterium]
MTIILIGSLFIGCNNNTADEEMDLQVEEQSQEEESDPFTENNN